MNITDFAADPIAQLQQTAARPFGGATSMPPGVYTSETFFAREFDGIFRHGLGSALLATRPASGTTDDGRPLAARPLHSATEPSRVELSDRHGARPSPPVVEFA